MKKKYITPRIELIVVDVEQPLASSKGSYYHYTSDGYPIYSDENGYYNPETGERYTKEWIEKHYPQGGSFWKGGWGSAKPWSISVDDW